MQKKSLSSINELELDVMEQAIGFHFSNKSDYHNSWFDYLLLEQKNKVKAAVTKYWMSMLKNNATYLPGKNLILSDSPDIEIVQYSILSLLENWQHCKNKTLAQLLKMVAPVFPPQHHVYSTIESLDIN